MNCTAYIYPWSKNGGDQEHVELKTRVSLTREAHEADLISNAWSHHTFLNQLRTSEYP